MPSVDPLSPTIDTVIDLKELGYGVELRKAIVPLLNKVLDWNVSNESHIELERASGLTNCVFFVRQLPQSNNEKPPKCVLRIYGDGVGHLIDRTKELRLLAQLSSIKLEPLLLPSLLGTFTNGRFEQFLESTTLTWDEMRSQSERIALIMNRLHHLIPPPENTTPETYSNIQKWFPFAKTVFLKKNAGVEDLEEFDFDFLEKEIGELKIVLAKLNSPLVFAHNDMQGGNILRLADGSDQLAVVDFEYSGYNFRGFDLANHICEWMFNYNSQNPHLANINDYPNQKQLESFLQAYLDAENSFSSSSSSPPLSSPPSLRELKIEVEAFTLASHVMWGLWGLASSQSHVDFDYFGYGMERLRIFLNTRLDIYKRVNSLYLD